MALFGWAYSSYIPLIQLFTLSFTKMHAHHCECFPPQKEKYFFLFSPEPLCVPPSCFSDKDSFLSLLCLVSPVDSAFHHPACSQEAPVAPGRPAVSLMTHVTCCRLALVSGRGKHGGGKACAPEGFIKTPGHPP